jgi:hypothetical protein
MSDRRSAYIRKLTSIPSGSEKRAMEATYELYAVSWRDEHYMLATGTADAVRRELAQIISEAKQLYDQMQSEK